MGEINNLFDTYAFTIDLVPRVLEKSCFVGQVFEYKWKTKQKGANRKRKIEMRNEKKWRSPPSRNNLGRAPQWEGPRPSH